MCQGNSSSIGAHGAQRIDAQHVGAQQKNSSINDAWSNGVRQEKSCSVGAQPDKARLDDTR